MRLLLHNFRGLNNFWWAPPENRVSVLIGANGSGKTSVCAALRFLTRAWNFSTTEAARESFKDLRGLRPADGTDTVLMGIEMGDIQWGVTLQGDHLQAQDTYILGGRQVKSNFDKAAYYSYLPCVFMGDSFHVNVKGTPTNQRMEGVLLDLALSKESRKFVEETLADAFPNLFESLDFSKAGSVSIREQGSPAPSALSDVSGGMVQLLMVMAALVNVKRGGTVIFDNPTTNMHPYAVKVMFERMGDWAWEHKITVLMTTHNPVLLNQFINEPEHVYVLTSDKTPAALTDLYNADFIQGFTIGDLFSCDNMGSNVDVLSGMPDRHQPVPFYEWSKMGWLAHQTVHLGKLAIGELYATGSFGTLDDES